MGLNCSELTAFEKGALRGLYLFMTSKGLMSELQFQLGVDSQGETILPDTITAQYRVDGNNLLAPDTASIFFGRSHLQIVNL